MVYVERFDQVVIIGGYYRGYLDHVSFHSMPEDSWGQIPQKLKLGRSGVSGILVGETIYAVCGWTRQGATNSIEKFPVEGLVDQKKQW